MHNVYKEEGVWVTRDYTPERVRARTACAQRHTDEAIMATIDYYFTMDVFGHHHWDGEPFLPHFFNGHFPHSRSFFHWSLVIDNVCRVHVDK